MASSSFAPKKDNMGSSPSESTRLDLPSGSFIPTTPTTITQVLKKIPSSILLLSALILSICLVSRAQQSSNSDSFSSINASKSLTTSSPEITNAYGVNFLVRTRNFSTSNPQIFYKGSGCGSGKKCTCKATRNGLEMQGFGTNGALTGLAFGCNFEVDGQRCTVSVDIPYWGSNSISCSCAEDNIENCEIGSGKFHNNNKMKFVKKIPKSI